MTSHVLLSLLLASPPTPMSVETVRTFDLGKMSFEEDKLAENISVFVEQVRHAKPSGVKGNFVNSITIAGTMTPGVKVSM